MTRPDEGTRYAAFLRGINVGGRRSIKMAELRAAFEDMGFTEVRTVQTSGNVIFEAPGEEPDSLAERIADGLTGMFGFPVVVVRPVAELRALVAFDPFSEVTITSETRLYVTFLPEESKGRRHVLSAISLSAGKGTPELMASLEKEFGPGITTRNWNTIVKVVAA